MAIMLSSVPTMAVDSLRSAHNAMFERGDIKVPHSRMTKACTENIGNLFVICMRQVTKGNSYHLLGVSDYYVMYRQRAKSVL